MMRMGNIMGQGFAPVDGPGGARAREQTSAMNPEELQELFKELAAKSKQDRDRYFNRLKDPIDTRFQLMSLDYARRCIQSNRFQRVPRALPASRVRATPFGIYIQEKRKLKEFYGRLRFRILKKTCRDAYIYMGKPRENIFKLLESRLDASMWRAGFVPDMFRGKTALALGIKDRNGRNVRPVQVNGKEVRFPSRRLQPGDVAAIRPEFRRRYALDMWEHLSRHHYMMTQPPAKMPAPGTDEFVWRLLELMAPLVKRAKQRRERMENLAAAMRKRELQGEAGKMPLNVAKHLNTQQLGSTTTGVGYNEGLVMPLQQCQFLMKPMHLEISWRLQKLIYLFSPQKLVFPCLIHPGELLLRTREAWMKLYNPQGKKSFFKQSHINVNNPK